MTAYHDLDTPGTMLADAAVAGRSLPGPVARLDLLEGGADLYAGWAQDLPKPQVDVTEAAQRLAAALGLPLD